MKEFKIYWVECVRSKVTKETTRRLRRGRPKKGERKTDIIWGNLSGLRVRPMHSHTTTKKSEYSHHPIIQIPRVMSYDRLRLFQLCWKLLVSHRYSLKVLLSIVSFDLYTYLNPYTALCYLPPLPECIYPCAQLMHSYTTMISPCLLLYTVPAFLPFSFNSSTSLL